MGSPKSSLRNNIKLHVVVSIFIDVKSGTP